ncbi:MAG: lipid A deacylase LpxR family protein [Pseudomonadota bacterium]
MLGSHVLIVALCIFSVSFLSAPKLYASSAADETFTSVQLENDFFANSGDRYYTHGTQLSVLKKQTPPDWLFALSELMPLYEEGSQLNFVNYRLAQKIFTPDDTEATAPVSNERPYAGYLYAGVSLISQIYSSANVDHGNMVEFTLGVVGPSAMSEQSQKNFHNLVGIDSPNGWDNQLEDEAALGVSYTRFWRLVQPLNGSLETGANPHMTLTVGNVYTYGAGGVMFRLGKRLKSDWSPPTIGPGFPGVPYFRGGSASSWYFYMGFESRLVGRNLFLDGNTFKDSHSVDKETLVGDMQFGFVYTLNNWRIAFSNMIRTREYATQKDNMHYGAVNISYRH